MPNFTPIGATCRPCGAKTPNRYLSNLNTGALHCPARNAAGKKSNEETKKKTELFRRNGPVIKSAESVLWPEESPWWETFMKEVGFEPRLKERWSYGW